MSNIQCRIEELKYDAYSGAIPTWYAYEEIDRLTQLEENQYALEISKPEYSEEYTEQDVHENN